MADIFVSYARADKARVGPLVAALEGAVRLSILALWAGAFGDPELAIAMLRRAFIDLGVTNLGPLIWYPALVSARKLSAFKDFFAIWESSTIGG